MILRESIRDRGGERKPRASGDDPYADPAEATDDM